MNPDVIVIGLGGMGTAAAWRLAQRGVRVLGLEQFSRGHARGSSHGHSRIIRQAYYEHPAYVPLVRRAYEGWFDLEQARGETLLADAPCLSLGPPGSPLVEGVRASAAMHGLEIEDLTPAQAMRRWPAFRLPAGIDCVVERTAGILAVDRCVRAMDDEARRLGADLRHNERVLDWKAGEGVEVRTDRATYTASRLVIAAGPWAALPVMRQVAFWFEGAEAFRRDRFPIFIAQTPGGIFYGLPALDPRGVKAAQHYGAPELASVEEIERAVSDADEAPVRAFLREHLTDAGPRTDASVCVYTLTPDRHFMIGEAGGAIMATGFSGHGFKFAPVVGEILADLALEGKTRWETALFAPGRFVA